MEDTREEREKIVDTSEDDAERIIEWAEAHHRKHNGYVDACEASDEETDRVGLPSAVIDEEDEEVDPQVLADRLEIEAGCSVEDECSERDEQLKHASSTNTA